MTARKSKAFGIAGEILAILEEIPFDQYHIEAGIQMRQGMLINGILTNIEVAYGLNVKAIHELEIADEYLIRKIMKGHSKCPIESLF